MKTGKRLGLVTGHVTIPLIVKFYNTEKTFKTVPLTVIVWLPTGAVLVVVIAPLLDEIERLWTDELSIDPVEL